MTDPRDLNPVLPGLRYDGGFLIDGQTLPYYSFSRPDETAHWSSEMTEFISESSRDHFIDRCNRNLALDGIRSALDVPGSRYIDIGCSSGYLLQEIVERYPQCDVFGSDYFSEGLVTCHQSLPKVPLIQMGITECPLGNDLFDAITCLNVLEHIPDDLKALRILTRLLKPRGRLVVTVPAAPHLFDLYDEVHHHVRRYTYRGLEQLLQACDVRILQMNYFGVIVYPAFFARKMLNRLLYSHLPFAQKMKKVKDLVQSTGRMKFLETVGQLESALGAHIRYPFGIRLYAVVSRP